MTRGRIATVLACLFALVCLPASAASLADAIAGERARAVAPVFPLQRFLVRADIETLQLAPDGRSAAYLRDDGRRRGLWRIDMRSGRRTRLLARTDATAVSWAADSRTLLLQAPRRLLAVGSGARARSSVLTALGPRAGRTLLGVDPYRPGVVVRVETRHGPWTLLYIDLRGHERVLYRGRAKPIGHTLDAAGRLGYVQLVEHDALVTYANTASGLQRRLRCTALERCSLLGMQRDGTLLLRTDKPGGLNALARMGRDGRLTILHRDGAGIADIADAVLRPGDGQPLLASYRSLTPELHALTPLASHVLRVVQTAWPGCDCDLQPDADGKTWLVTRRGDRMQAARWFALDMATSRLRPLLQAQLRVGPRRNTPPIPEAQLARRQPISWIASDGMTVHGFVTLPPGRDAARVPLVTSVHGGPWNQVAPGYSRIVQLLANRGYAVFEPDFRGSTGFGRQYMQAARGDFGNGRVQQDIVDGVEYLLRNGVGDRSRVAITGASFGGYATLLGLTYRSDLFKAGVAFVPPPDFAWNARWIQRSRAAAELSPVAPIERWMRWMQTDPGDATWMQRVRGQSPLANIPRLRSPVLLIAGGEDRRVSITGVVEYAARLAAAGKDVELLIDPIAGHSNDDDVSREATTYLLVTRLARVLGPAAPDVLSNRARLYLQQNLRLVSPAHVDGAAARVVAAAGR